MARQRTTAKRNANTSININNIAFTYLGKDDRGDEIPEQPRAVGLDGLHERFLEEQGNQLIPANFKEAKTNKETIKTLSKTKRPKKQKTTRDRKKRQKEKTTLEWEKKGKQ